MLSFPRSGLSARIHFSTRSWPRFARGLYFAAWSTWCAWPQCAWPQDAKADLSRAALKAYQEGEDRKAVILLQRMLKKYPSYGSARILLARIMLERGKYRVAYRLLRSVHPDNIPAS